LAAIVEFPQNDPIREYSPEEEQKLTENLLSVVREVHQGKWAAIPLTPDLLSELHRRVFKDVRKHAGRIRQASQGSERLSFGPHRSVHRNKVLPELLAAFKRTEREIRRIKETPNLPSYEAESIRIAAWIHAEIIRVHPFEDGSGRVGRLIMSIALMKLGLRPVAFESCRQEYIEAVNACITRGDAGLNVMCDLIFRVYPTHD